jgi:hypothetical protein
MPHGSFRRVLLAGRFAIKVPRPRWFVYGMRCNRWEREAWSRWRPVFGWANLCPVLCADPFGFFVVMPRAEQPVSKEDVYASLVDAHPNHDAEFKAEDYGRVNGSIVALDYGFVPDAKSMRERRAYYLSQARGR